MKTVMVIDTSTANAERLCTEMNTPSAGLRAFPVRVSGSPIGVADEQPSAVVIGVSADVDASCALVEQVMTEMNGSSVPVFVAGEDAAASAIARRTGAAVLRCPVDPHAVAAACVRRTPPLDAVLGLMKDAVLVRSITSDDGRPGRLLYANDAAAAIVGTTRSGLLEMSVEDILPTHKHTSIKRQVESMRLHGSTIFRTEIRRLSGSIIPVEMQVSRGIIDGEEVYVSVMRDISDSVSRELMSNELYQQVVESREYYLELFRTFPGLIWRSGRDGGCDYFNDTWLNYTGRTLEDERGDGWVESVHPEDRDRILTIYLSAFSKRQPFRMSYRMRRHDGMYRWVDDSGRPLTDPDGTFTGYLGVVTDIHNLVSIEQKLRSQNAFTDRVIETADAIIMTHDAEGRVTSFNTYAETLTGYTADEVIGKQWGRGFVAEPDLGGVAQMFERLKTGEETALRHVNGIITKSGETRIVEWHNTLMSDEPGREQVLSIGHDVTEREAMQRSLDEKREELERINIELEQRIVKETERRIINERAMMQQSKLAAMGEMIGAIAHQWRQPLNVVGLLVQDLEEAWKMGSVDDEYFTTLTDKTMRQLMHMSDTIDNFRDFFKPDRSAEPFAVTDAVNDTVRLVAEQMRHFNIAVVTRWDDAVDATITAIRSDVTQALVNIISNAKDAIAALPKKGEIAGTITIAVTGEADHVILTVTDTGGGMSHDVASRIFEPYFTTKDPVAGTGIGLYMTRQIIEKNVRGTIDFANVDGGAEFMLRLPRNTGMAGTPVSECESDTR